MPTVKSRGRRGHNLQIADAQCDDHADNRAVDRADRQRGDRGEQGLDQSGAALLREIRIRLGDLHQSLDQHGPRAVLRSPERSPRC